MKLGMWTNRQINATHHLHAEIFDWMWHQIQIKTLNGCVFYTFSKLINFSKRSVTIGYSLIKMPNIP